MKKCVTVWNYPGDRVENAYRFRELGFDAISWLGSEFAALTPEDDERVVAMLKTTGMQFTVHSRLPDPQKPEDCEAFRREIRRVAAWQQKYGFFTATRLTSGRTSRRRCPTSAKRSRRFGG